MVLYALLRFVLFEEKTSSAEGESFLLLLEEKGEGCKSKQAER
jgi:hypothetical protein